jgi:PAS domain S-box-containing protein
MTKPISTKLRHNFFNQFPDGVIFLDQNDQILDMNRQAEDLLGWQLSELEKKTIHDCLCPDEAEFSHIKSQCAFNFQSLLEQKQEQESEPHSFESWWLRKDGVYINVDIRLFESITEQAGYFVIFYDCSQRHFSHSETQNLSLFAELSPAPILQFDRGAAIFYANPSMTDLMVKHGFSDLGQPNILPQELADIIAQSIDNKETITNIESQYQNIYFTWNFHPVPQSGETLVQVYGLDISERKLSEKRLTELKELAEEHSHYKSTFLANMSHELRTPMNGIIGLTQLLKETELDEIQYDYADKVSKSADSLLLLINDILDISKIEAGKLDIDPHVFDLHEMLYESLSVLELLAKQKKVSLELRIDPAIPNNLIGDALRIRQIILNFLTNAVKFTDSGGYVFLNVSLQELKPTSTRLLFSIEDTGIGIPQDKLSHVFGKFNQVSKSTTRQFGGTGLGLAISKELAELMDGKVGVESTEGSGSTFWLELDLTIDSFSLANSTGASPILKNKQCYILAGHPLSHEVLEELLQSWNMQTSLYKDTHELRGQAESGISPDFIFLCNINEPQILEEFSAFCKSTPDLLRSKLIFISNYLDQECISQLKRWQIDAYLANPYLPDDLKQLLLAVFETTDTPNSDIISIFGLKEKLKNNKKNDSNSAAKSKYILLAEDNIINQKVAKALLLKLGC